MPARLELMHVEHRGARPNVHASAWVAPTAVLVGDVHIGAESRVLWNAVLSAEDGRVELGERCVVMEHALVRGRAAHPVIVGDDVLIGPHAHVNGAQLGDGAFVATGASLFPGAVVGAEGAVAIRGVVHVMSRLAAGERVPIGWVAVGDPAEMLPPSEVDEIRRRVAEVDFFQTVYGVPREAGATERMLRQTAWLGAHRADRVL
jgi:carbonic anhydrase/acetyltransferase-like protein (isoleucine patch superfamily)